MRFHSLILLLFTAFLSKLSVAQEFTYYANNNTATNTFHGNDINTLYKTKSGSLFLITDGGISTNYNNVWKSIVEFEGYPIRVRTFYELDGDTLLLLLDKTGESSTIVTKYNYVTNTIKRDPSHQIQKYLKQGYLSCMEKDGKGNFWIGATYGGVSIIGKDSLVAEYYYDFINNKSPIGTNEITTIFKDAQDNMWVGTVLKGLYKFDGLNWTNYTKIFESDATSSSNPPCVRINKVIQDGNMLWVATGDGLCSFDGTTWKKYEPKTQNVFGIFEVLSVNIDANKTLWVGSNYGLYSLTNGTWTTRVFPDIVVTTFTYNKIRSIEIAADGTKLLATDFGIVEYTDVFQKRTVTDGFEGWNATSVQVDKDDNVWVGHSKGMSKYDGKTWVNYNKFHGINELQSIYQFAIDSKKQKWICGQYNIYKFNDTTFTNYWSFAGLPLRSSTPNEIKVSSKDHVWVGSDDGLSHYDLNTWTAYTTANGLPHNRVRSLAIDKNDAVWVGTDNGLARLSGNTWTYYNPGIPGTYANYVLNICTDSNNNVWCSTAEDLHYFDGTSWKIIKEFHMASINDITVDAANAVWISTYNSGIYKFDGEVWENYKDLLNTGYTMPVYELAIDSKGNKWVAGDGYRLIKITDNGAGSKTTHNKIYGYVFNDANNNKVKDPAEKGISNRIIQLSPHNFTATDGNGKFITYANTGLNTIKLKTPDHWIASTDSVQSFTYTEGDVIDTIYFGIMHDENITEYALNITTSRSRTSFESHYWLDYYNYSIQQQTAAITFQVDTLVEIKSITPTPLSVVKNLITWQSVSMDPYAKGQFHIVGLMPDFNFAGDTLINAAVLTDGKHTVKDTLMQVLTNSYDPNDKQVQEGRDKEKYVLMGTPLTYTVRFQNTGTDTAYKVIIKDDIDTNLDIATLRIVGSSHPCKIKVFGKNTVSFIFEDINLPHQAKDDLKSNGYVTFTVDPLASEIQDKEKVSNTARIYFDFNPAIYTNRVSNTFVNEFPPVLLAPVVVNAVTLCQHIQALPLSATGTNLKWYTQATAGTAASSAPTPITDVPGTTNYYVSQSLSGYEGPRAMITVTVIPAPVAPTVTPVSYCLNTQADPLTAAGTGLKWYTEVTAGTGAVTAPTPVTTAAGTIKYYVSQTAAACESARSVIAVTVHALPAAVITASGPTTIFEGHRVPLQANDGAGLLYRWYNENIQVGTGRTYEAAAAGSYSVEVTDANTCSKTSEQIMVTVKVNQPSVITITSPKANTSVAGAITITADVSDPDGNITLVEFMAGSTVLGTATGAPYSFVWNNPPAGDHEIAIRITDSNDGVTTSTASKVHAEPITTGISITDVADARIYPNPASNFVYVESDADLTDAGFTAVDVMGNEHLLVQHAGKINIGNLSAGTYILVIRKDNSIKRELLIVN
jgi:uncharacterized repeat protein (TIGR01451 family)